MSWRQAVDPATATVLACAVGPCRSGGRPSSANQESWDAGMAILQELEDIAGTSWWAGVLATLASQSGNAYLRFVGRVDGQRRYKGATFPAPRTLGVLPPQEAWAPGMTKSLQELRREIEHDGWVEAGRGAEPWAFNYEGSASG
jgi:hypothetical protein